MPFDAAPFDRFVKGEPAALEAVYRRYVRLVAGVLQRGAFSAAGRVNAADREAWYDLIQETFARAFADSARKRTDPTREYQPYLMAICRNVLVDYWRKRGKEVLEIDMDALMEEPRRPDASWQDARAVVAAEEYVTKLPEALRALHDARYVKGLSQDDAAKMLGLSRQQLRTQENQLRQGLAGALQQQGLVSDRKVRRA